MSPSICSGAIEPIAHYRALLAYSAAHATAAALAIVQSLCSSIGQTFGPGPSYCYDVKGSTLRTSGETLYHKKCSPAGT